MILFSVAPVNLLVATPTCTASTFMCELGVSGERIEKAKVARICTGEKCQCVRTWLAGWVGGCVSDAAKSFKLGAATQERSPAILIAVKFLRRKSPRPAASQFHSNCRSEGEKSSAQRQREERVKTEGKMQRAKRQKSEDKRADERLTLFLLVQL